MKKLLLALFVPSLLYCMEESKSSIFELLPQEVYHQVIGCLSLKDIVSMRLLEHGVSSMTHEAMEYIAAMEYKRSPILAWVLNRDKHPILAETGLENAWSIQVAGDIVIIKSANESVALFDKKTQAKMIFTGTADPYSIISLHMIDYTTQWNASISESNQPVVLQLKSNTATIDLGGGISYTFERGEYPQLVAKGSRYITFISGIGIKVYNTLNGTLLQTIVMPANHGGGFKVSANGKILATSSGECIKIWDAGTGLCINTIPLGSFNPFLMSLSDDGKYLAIPCRTSFSISEATGFTVYEVESAEPLYIKDTVQINADDKVLVVTDKGYANDRLHMTNTDDIKSIFMTTDNEYIFASSLAATNVFHAKTGEHVFCIKGFYTRLLAVSSDIRFIAFYTDKRIRIIDLTNFKQLAYLECEKVNVLNQLAFSSNNKELLGIFNDGSIAIWNKQ